MSKRITEKQAVAVAKWLGRCHTTTESEIFYFKNWLYSAEGQEALRSKLLNDGKSIYEETGLVAISWEDKTVEKYDLLKAVLKMLKEGDRDE